MPRVTAKVPFYNDRVVSVMRDGEETETKGQVFPGDEFEADAAYAAEAKRLGTVDFEGEISQEEIDAVVLEPSYSVSQTDIDRQKARLEGREVGVQNLAGPTMTATAAARTADNQPRPSVAPTTTARATKAPAPAPAPTKGE